MIEHSGQIKLFVVAALFVAQANLDVAAQSFSSVLAPQLRTGQQEIGVAYEVRVGLRNDGPTYPTTLVTTARQVDYWFGLNGLVIPYSYNFEVINNSTGKPDAAVYVNTILEDTGDGRPTDWPSGAVKYWRIGLSGVKNIINCPLVNVPTPGTDKPQCVSYPNDTNSYTIYFRAYDTGCSLAHSVGSPMIGHSSCVIYQAALSSGTISWEAYNPVAGIAVAQNSTIPVLRNSAPPIPPGQIPPQIGTVCSTGLVAQNVASMIRALGGVYPGTGYCQP